MYRLWFVFRRHESPRSAILLSGVTLIKYPLHMFFADMEIHLGAPNRVVPKYFLNDANIGPVV